MSWSVNGRTYHNYEEYLRAKSGQEDQRLRRLVDRLEIPPADTSRLESRLAEAQVRREAVSRLGDRVRRETTERRQRLGEHREQIAESFAEVKRSEEHLLADLDAAGARLQDQVEALEEQRRVEARRTSEDLASEIEADRRNERRTEDRQKELLQRTSAILSGLAPDDLERLGLDQVGVKATVERAAVGGAEGLELARRAYDQALALESEAARRGARLEALGAVFHAEVEELRKALEFSSEDRDELVGEGDSALDAPLRRELERVARRARSVDRYEDHERRFASLHRALDTVAVQILDLSTQVEDFDRLEEARFGLVQDRLEDSLEKMLGEEVELEEVVPGDLALQPVEAKLKTASGERIDCTVALDGTLRLHHHGHADQASCARAARRLADAVPELMAMTDSPQLDVAAERRESAGRTSRQTAREMSQDER